MDKRRQLERPSEVAQLVQPGNQAAARTQLARDPAASESAEHYKSQYQASKFVTIDSVEVRVGTGL